MTFSNIYHLHFLSESAAAITSFTAAISLAAFSSTLASSFLTFSRLASLSATVSAGLADFKASNLAALSASVFS